MDLGGSGQDCAASAKQEATNLPVLLSLRISEHLWEKLSVPVCFLNRKLMVKEFVIDTASGRRR